MQRDRPADRLPALIHSLWIYPMLRCVATGLTAAIITLALPELAQAQSHRPFPPQALRGELVIGAAPEVLLNGQPARLSPGARVRGEDNLIAPPATLAGRRLVVHYTREATTGLLHEVWVLNAVELARKPWPLTEAEARAWAFDPVAQVWSKR
jgi:hypothetical protein